MQPSSLLYEGLHDVFDMVNIIFLCLDPTGKHSPPIFSIAVMMTSRLLLNLHQSTDGLDGL